MRSMSHGNSIQIGALLSLCNALKISLSGSSKGEYDQHLYSEARIITITPDKILCNFF